MSDVTEVAAISEVADETGAGEPVAAGTAAEQVASAESAPDRPTLPWSISARTATGLPAQAARLHEYLSAAGSPVEPADVAYSLLTTRAALEHRAVVLGSSAGALMQELAAAAAGDESRSVLRGTADRGGKTAALFTGQGSQRSGMGRDLYSAYPVFADALDAVCAHFDAELPRPLREVMFAGGDAVDQTAWAQPALFAYEVALFRLAESFGVAVDLLAGHSIGELAAAHVAGVFSLADACRLVAARGRLMQALPSGGVMVAVEAPEADVTPRLTDGVCVAAVNGPLSVVLSGPEAATMALAEDFRAAGRRVKRLVTSHAFHSALMDPMLEEFRAVAATIDFAVPRIPVISNLTGEPAAAEDLASPEYWVRHVREAVRFADGVAALARAGAGVFVEIGPDAVLSALVPDCLNEGSDPLVVPLVRKSEPEADGVVHALSALHVHGIAVDWRTFFAPMIPKPKVVELPTYAFENRRYWPVPTGMPAGDFTAAGLTDVKHPLLGAGVTVADSGGVVLTGRWSQAAPSWLADHVVGGSVLVPGTALLEVVVRAGDEVGCAVVEELVLAAPLVLPATGAVEVQVVVDPEDGSGSRGIGVFSRTAGAIGAAWTRHAFGSVSHNGESDTSELADLTAWPPADAEAVAVEGFYDVLATTGFGYGPAFQGLRSVWKSPDGLVLAEVALPEGVDGTRFGLHPALLDAALHAVVFAGLAETERGRLPFAWSGMRLTASGASTVRVAMRATGPDTVSLQLADACGAAVAFVESLTLRELADATATAGPAVPDGLVRLEWLPVPAPASKPGMADPQWAVIGADPLGFSRACATAGIPVSVFEDLGAATEADSTPDTLFVLCDAHSAPDPAAAAHTLVADVLTTLQAFLDDAAFENSRLVVITSGAVGDEVRDPAAAAVWGLVRSAIAEHPGRVALADLDGAPESVTALAALLSGADTSGLVGAEVLVRAGAVRVPRLMPIGADDDELIPPSPEGPAAWRLAVGADGTLEGLSLPAVPEVFDELAAGQVRVAVRAAGLNFRDVLNALGMYPGETGPLGQEGAGVVTEVGPDVTGLAVGDRVLGMFPGAFGPVAVADARMVVPVPEGWSFAQAASVPLVFLTAYYALRDLGDLKRGEKVLIHAAAGGVGMAAVQLAQYLGAEVFATASVGKWDVVRELGIASERIASSRTLEFEDAFTAATGGGGVDVVLDSLAGDFVDASLRLMAPGGRFLEMGKTDVRDADDVAARHGGVAYRAFDLFDAGPDRIGEMLRDLVELFDEGSLRPLPLRAWDVRQARRAFRHMAQAKHVGKVVLTIARAWDPDASVLVTGGIGGLGSELVRHLAADRGVRNLVLAGRRGANTPGAAELRDAVEASGARVDFVACDVSDRDQVSHLLQGLPNLTAVVHLAGVVDDATIASLDRERVDRVLAPKADAVVHLDELTSGMDLASFIVFSSVAGQIGGPGQGNYAAANAFLDAFAARRASSGRATTAIAWGPWVPANGGMTAQLTDADLRRMARSGMPPISIEQGMTFFDASIERAAVSVTPLALDVAALSRQGDALAPLLRGLVKTPVRRTAAEAGATDAATGGLRERLAGRTGEEQQAILLDLVRTQAALVLGYAGADTIAPGQAFRDLGFDSLTAVELRNRLGGVTGLRLPATLLFDYPSAEALAGHLRAEVGGDAAAAADAPARAKQQDAPGARTASDDEPIAIVSIGCRFPGDVRSPEQLWDLVLGGGDALTGFPADRGWDLDSLFDDDPDAPGKCYVRDGGFLHDAAQFDPVFFGISPREALSMDPQQRLLLETTWETMERAGLDPEALKGSSTGVFVGTSGQDYLGVLAVSETVDEGYIGTGNTAAVMSGRISYTFGFEGPAMTVDTACSSSLVALHQAVAALRAGECSLAFAGGVTVMSTPNTFIGFARQRGLAPNGRCKAFSDDADGTIWAEGAGLLLLERLSDARANGHPVLAVVRGSAVNQDGASNGLTAPNGPSQQRVIRAALADAGVAAADVDLVEAHGTGTSLGDPIEAQALLATYGRGRRADSPVWLGSIKSNIGHTQAAAGVAGVIKMVMALRNGVMPPTLHVAQPSTHVDWTSGAVELLTSARAWDGGIAEGGAPRRAGVSAFGISGTNAHVILEEAPAAEQTADAGSPFEDPGEPVLPVVPWVVSARSESGVAGQFARLADFVSERSDTAPSAVGRSLVNTRGAMEYRGVVVGADREALLAGLADPGSWITGRAVGGGRTAFLFTGQGSQWSGMGRELYAAYPVFASALNEVLLGLDAYLDRPLRGVMFDGAELLDQTGYTQPALFAFEVALYRLLEDWGVRPDMVAGHSIGEAAAAYVAGVFSLLDACRLVAARGRLMQELPSGGAMVAVRASESEVSPLLVEGVCIAAVNGPSSVVLSGAEDAVLELAEDFRASGVRVKRLATSHAFHSALMEPMLEEFRDIAGSIEYREPSMPVVSNVTGDVATAEQLCSPEYWVRHVREAVRFHDGVQALRAAGVTRFVEVGPGTALTSMVAESFEAASTATAVAMVRKGRPEPVSVVSGLARLHVEGVTVDWDGFFGPAGGETVSLPTYAFEHQRYWPTPVATGAAAGSVHPLLDSAVVLADSGAVVLTGRWSRGSHAWLADHVVAGSVLVPGTALLEVVVRAGDEVGCGVVEELVLAAPLVLPADGAVEVQVVVDPEDGSGGSGGAGTRNVAVFARLAGSVGSGGSLGAAGAGWTRHAFGSVREAGPAEAADAADAAVLPEFEAWPPAGAEAVGLDGFYGVLAETGFGYGPVFQGLRSVWKGAGGVVFAEVALPTGVDGARFGLHPALLDAALHAVVFAGLEPTRRGRLPFMWSGARLVASGASTLRIAVEATGADSVTLRAADASGAPVAVIEALTLRELGAGPVGGSPVPEGLLRTDWTPVPVAVPVSGSVPVPGSALVPSTDGGVLRSAVRWAVVGPDPLDFAARCDTAGVHVEAYADLDGLAASAAGGAPVAETVFVVCDGTAPGDRSIAEVAHDLVGDILSTLQTWLTDAAFDNSRLVIVTNGAAGDEVRDPAAAAVRGLVRSAISENPGRFALVDIDAAAESVAALISLVTDGSPASEVLVRGGAVTTPRLVPVGSVGSVDDELVAPAADGWRLAVGGDGTLEGLALEPVPRLVEGELAAGQVRVAVRAAGLNFRDVLNALGMYPGEAGLLGQEGAGVVTEVGPGVTGLAAGDRVLGMFPGSFGPTVIADARMLVPVPEGWSFVQAASVPLVFLTAYYALRDLGDLKSGERILVHAAAGGVGMAAVQLAQYLGAEVFATASAGKWDVVRGQGIAPERIASSRTLEFEDAFTRATGGAGVDVVLDSLAGDFVDASLRLTAPGGRFLEMGKTDIRDAATVAAQHDGVRYRAFDLIEAGPDRIGEMLRDLVALFEQGVLRPLPLRAWDVRQARRAFRHMAQAKHVGKVVLTVPRAWDPDGSVLLTGGIGGLGSEMARHLAADRGVRKLVLAGRRGVDTPGAAELRESLEGLGARVEFVACDVSDREQVWLMLQDLPDLTAIVHLAGVVDDATVGSLDRERVDRVLAPKVDAVVHLDELTRGLDLASFVVFSSIAGQIGGPGQGNYAAANAFLDAFAAHRSSSGRATTAIAWGPWVPTGGGMTAQLTDADLRRMARSGMPPISIEQGMALFDAAMDRALASVTPLALDVAALGRQGEALAPLLRGLVKTQVRRRTAAEAGASSDAPEGVRERLVGRSGEEQQAILLELVRTQAALVLGYGGADTIPPDRSLPEIGFDSLTAVELRNRLGGATRLKLSATLVFDHPTPEALAAHLVDELAVSGFADSAGAVADELTAPTALTTPRAPTTPAASQAPAPAAVTGPLELADSISALFRAACRGGQVEQGYELLRSAAVLRPAFSTVEEYGKELRPVRLTTGPAEPVVVCFSSFVALAGVHQYARLAAAFRGERDVWALSVPGFLKDERLPRSREVVTQMQAAAVREAVGDAPFVLMGSSGGGLMAHAAASVLEESGTPASAVVLLDTYPATEDSPLVKFEADLIDGMFDREQFTALDASRLTAMSRYFDLFGGWQPGKLAAPTLLVRASEPIVAGLADEADSAGGGWQTEWDGAHTTLDVPGNHFTMMEAHAADTARAVREWIAAYAED